MKIRNVLIFPAGTEIGLEILNALKYCKEIRIYGAGDGTSSHAMFAYPEYHFLPNISEANCIPELVVLCRRLSIDYVLPAYDDVIVSLSEYQEQIPATVITSAYETCEITRSKSKTYCRLKHIIKVPAIYDPYLHSLNFPLLVKPDKGQGSSGVTRVNNEAELNAAIRKVSEPLVCEYLPGTEYTVDCFSDREHGLLFAKARMRRRTRNGISVNTVTEDVERVEDLARKIGQKLSLRGAWFFQLKRDNEGGLTLLEVAPRIAGSVSTHRVTGINFPLLSIFEHERIPLKILLNSGKIELGRALGNCYHHEIVYDTVYIDLDDTLIFRDQVNTNLVKFIFQCINQEKTVKLITRHNQNVIKILAKYRLASLFDDVIQLSPGINKSDYIVEPKAILVDDSFAERIEVATRRRIPTFDCSMIEVLINGSQFPDSVVATFSN
jgi:carbamoyl-phosphate synthase large subunit